MDHMGNILPRDLVKEILQKLGVRKPVTIDLPGLTTLYGAWCRKVPFDNIQKRIHLAADNPEPLPGARDTDFFQQWLDVGTGGTCWAGNAALQGLLTALGFSAQLATATMMTGNEQPPNHGTVVVACENQQFLVDASMLHGYPLLLHRAGTTYLDHPAWGLTCKPENDTWVISWRPLHMLLGCKCRLEELSVSRECFLSHNEVTRTVSPFNDDLYIRRNTENGVLGITGSLLVTLTTAGEVVPQKLSPDEREELLVKRFGIAREIVQRIPENSSSGSS